MSTNLFRKLIFTSCIRHRGFLCLVLLPNQVFPLLGRKVPPSQLVPADPGDHGEPVWKIFLKCVIRDLRVCLHDPVAVMTVHDYAIPDDQRVDHPAICQNVFFQLPVFLVCEGRNLSGKFRINLQIHLVPPV